MDPLVYAYSIDPNIISADDLDIHDGRVYLTSEPTEPYIWAYNVKIKKDYVYDSVGILFDSRVVEQIVCLLFIIRYGFIRSYVERYIRSYFDDPEATITDYKEANYYTHNGRVYTHKYISCSSLWGAGVWGKGTWGNPHYTYDEYFDVEKPTFTIEPTITDAASTKNLDYLTKCIPIWLNFNILCKLPYEETYNGYTDEASEYHGKGFSDSYNKIKDGSISKSRWGYGRWGVGTWGAVEYQPYIKVIYNEHN
jgi:hypothetical protein